MGLGKVSSISRRESGRVDLSEVSGDLGGKEPYIESSKYQKRRKGIEVWTKKYMLGYQINPRGEYYFFLSHDHRKSCFALTLIFF